MKLLLDQNLSPRLVAALADVYPGARRVASLGMGCVDDEAVWEYARANGCTIVSKDADFSDLSVARGYLPS